ncbi:MAG: site-specific DNA-methyltransferase [Candidatus Gerdarchaeota archaeon]|nr:MAG: site-specific DNA-methyltransferase [Candidatus Gerdarchaeota archaeon]
MNYLKENLNKVIHGDCLEVMKKLPDNSVDLVLTDPPYGIGFGEFNRTNKTKSGERYKANKYKNSDWDDNIPSEEYFNEIQRISKHQIIWGGNYFPCLWKKGCKGFIFWYKGNPVENFSDGELAWTSFDKVAKQVNYRYYGNLEGGSSAIDKTHPTQKPVELMVWCLENYLMKDWRKKEGNERPVIFDGFAGSGTTAVAAKKCGCDFILVETEEEYVKDCNQRLSQETMF